MKKRKIKRLWHGLASLRDYEVEDAMREGGIVLTCGEEKMTLAPEQLKKGFQTAPQPFKSKIISDMTYTLIDFQWKPDKEKPRGQLKFWD